LFGCGIGIVREKIEQFILWLGDFVEDGVSGRPSVKRFGLALSVTVLCGVMLGLGAVIAYSTFTADSASKLEMVRSCADTLKVLAGLVLAAVTTGYLVDRASIRKSNSDAAQ
jgi:hypothetical protein